MDTALLGLFVLGLFGPPADDPADEDAPAEGEDQNPDAESPPDDAGEEDPPKGEEGDAPEGETPDGEEPESDESPDGEEEAEGEGESEESPDAEGEATDAEEPEPDAEEEPEPEPEPEPGPPPAPWPEPEATATVVETGPVRTTPRMFETLMQWREDEVAFVSNKRDDFRFVPGIQVRNQVGFVSGFQLDRTFFNNRYNASSDPTANTGGPVLDTGRVRFAPAFQFGTDHNIELIAQIDAVNGRWAPEGFDNPVLNEIVEVPPSNQVGVGQPPGRQTLRLFDPRHLYLQWTSGIGQVRIGQMGFTWGLGILANDGNNKDRFGDLKFGNDGPGDILERFLFGTRPFTPLGGKAKNVILAAGADLVFRDERAELVRDVDGDGRLQRGDMAGHAILVVRYQPEETPWNWIGAYGVFRSQKSAEDFDVYENDDLLQVGVGDIAGQGVHWLSDDLQLMGAFEIAMVGGRTRWAYNEFGDHRVFQSGAAARAYIGDMDKWQVGFDTGYASGDRNPSDNWITNFTFDQGATPGLILFPQVIGWRSARTEILATNGDLTGVPLNGTQYIPTRGAMTNAIYVFPKARYGFRDLFEVWGGPMMAFAPVPIANPYGTRLNGGAPANALVGDGDNRYYGTEIDLGVRARYDIRKLWLQIGVQGGVLLPGAGLANEEGETDPVIGAVWLRTEIRY